MATSEPKTLLDRSFEVGIILKGLDGVLEAAVGLLLVFVSPAGINRIAAALTRSELSQDPHDFVATHILKTAHGLTGSSVAFGAAYLLSHGLVKIVLVAALLRNALWAYPWMIAFLLAFIIYQAYRLVVHATTGLALLTIFDGAIAWLTYREWRTQQSRRHPVVG